MRGWKITLKNQGLVAQIKRNLITKPDRLKTIDIIFKQIDQVDNQDKN